MLISGIYKITNLITQDSYIGSSVNIIQRKNKHFSDLNLNKHFSLHLQRSYNKHGKQNFSFEILAKAPKEYLIKLEQWFLDKLKPTFNKREIAESNLGVVFTEEHRRKIGEANKKRIISEEQKLKMSNSLKGRKLSKEHISKMSFNRKGEKNPSAKLNWDKIDKIRNSNLTVKELSNQYQVSQMTIYKILNNKIWNK